MSRIVSKMYIIAALVSLAIGALLAASCGSDSAASPKAANAAPGAPTGTVDPHAGWPKVFRLGVFGGDDAEATLQNNKPLQDYLAKQLGIPVDVTTGTSYSAVIEAMGAGKVDAMSVGPFSYILAVQEAKAEALAASVSSSLPKGTAVYDPAIAPYYISVIFTKKGTGIKTLNDLKGKAFNFVDPASTSGHLAPKTLLIKNGINPDKDMQTVFAGSHPTSVLSVYNGKAPAGATYEGNLVNLAASGQIKWCQWPDKQIGKMRTPAEIQAVYDACPDGSIVVLAQTDPIPNTPFAVRQDLPQSFKDAVKNALLSQKDDPELVKTRGSWYVDPHEAMGLPTLDAFYNPLRDIAKLLNLNLKELQ